MAHPSVNTPVSPQELMNKAFVFSVSAMGQIPAGYAYASIITSAQTVVKAAPGLLGKIALQSTLVSSVKVYDNVVSGGNVLAYLPVGTSAGSVFSYDVHAVSGIVVSSGAGADTFNVFFA